MRYSLLPLLLSLVLGATPVLADWTLDPKRSHLAFVSIKSNDVAEINTFGEMQGGVDASGQVRATLMLDSVETLVPIRNERMRQFLFETTDYKEAVLSAKIDPALLDGMAVGDVTTIDAEGDLSLHGKTQPMTLRVLAAKVDDKTVVVASAKPLIVDATKFGMTDGVDKLREIAGLSAISKAVPVTFVVTLVDVAG